MRAVLTRDDKSLAWSEVPDPVRRADEVLIDIRAAAVNRADLMQRDGSYPSPPGWPAWMGLEVAGVVADAPADGRWRVGDEVCALLGGGGYAERVAVPQELVLPVPPGLSMAEAAAVPEAFATSHLNLCLEAGMKAGEMVLIQAGASGLGMVAIQLAKAFGARVMTTVGSAGKVDFVRMLGADVVVNRKTDDLAAAMAEHPVDVALDCVAGPAMGPCLEHMAVGGRWVVIATLAGPRTEIDVNAFFRKGLRLIGSTLRSRTLEAKARILADLEAKLWPKFAGGEIKVLLHRVLPMPQAEQAHDILLNRQNLGKVVLTLE